MRKLGDRNYSLISRGVKQTGSYNPDEIFYAFEEELYMNEVQEIYDFLAWVNEDPTNRCFGHGNYELRFKQWKDSLKGAVVISRTSIN